MLSGIGKRKGLARKNAAVVIGTTGILLAAGVFLAGSEQQAASKCIGRSNERILRDRGK